MKISQKKELGNMGEQIAAKYLEKNKYKILTRNFYCRQGEINIIAVDGKEIVFIEVKTRRSNIFGRPSEAVNYSKQMHLYRSAKYFLYRHDLLNQFIRFDVIEVLIDNKRFNINHIKQVM